MSIGGIVMGAEDKTLLDVKNLKTFFHTENGVVRAVNGVSFKVKKGEKVAIVGESGSGKSITSFSIMGLINPPGKIEDGKILFDGKDLTKVKEKEMRLLRGKDISMIFQEPLTSLNPVFTVGHQISEAILIHQKVTRRQAKEISIEMLKKVGMPRAEEIYNSYPHELSGGMRQRVMIAMALSCNPKLLIADEPTTALDVTIQAQIIHLMKELTSQYNTSIILITHDLGVVADFVDRVVVMYAGQVVEEADVFTLFEAPKHPYTKGLLNSTPRIHDMKDKLETIEGVVPTPLQLPKGCKFHPRCPFAMDICKRKEPVITQLKNGNKIRCWLHADDVDGGD